MKCWLSLIHEKGKYCKNISEGINYYKVRCLEHESKGRCINNRIITYFIENFIEK